MKNGWQMELWKDVLEIRSGRNQKAVENPDGQYPIYGSGGNVMGYADDYICEENTTIIGRKGSINNPLLIEEKFWNVDTAFGLTAGERLDKKYLYYFCLSFDFTERDKGSGRPSLVKGDLYEISMPVPPLPEQERIVAKLDAAFAAIDQAKANVEQNLQNAKELFQSKLNEVFSASTSSATDTADPEPVEGWVEKKLGDVISVLNGYAFKSKEAIETSNTQLLRMSNLYKNKLDLNRSPVFYPDSYTDEFSDYVLEEGDMIMSLTGTVGKTDYGFTVRISDVPISLLLNQRLMKIEVLDEANLNKDYLHNYLLSPEFLERLYATANGTRQANLSSRTILTLSIRFPKSAEQQLELVELINRVKKLTNQLQKHYTQKLAALEELKKSLLERAFKGEI